MTTPTIIRTMKVLEENIGEIRRTIPITEFERSLHGNDEENKSICFGDTRLRTVADDVHRVYIWVQNSGLYCIQMEPYYAEGCYMEVDRRSYCD